ncbi:MAG: hypothetical protein Q4C95_03550 [Planctomycetia bacterium]|nr:hypothetical protein [Planctomycetia bacterium]
MNKQLGSSKTGFFNKLNSGSVAKTNSCGRDARVSSVFLELPY